MGIRKIIMLVVVFACIPLLLFSQDKWGYGVASVKSPDAPQTEFFFVSKVVDLTRLNRGFSTQNPEARENKQYAQCIADWFYQKMKERNNKTAILVRKDEILGDVELHSDFKSMSERFMTISDNEKASVFMNKRTAKKKRKDFIKIARQSNCVVVKVK